MAWDHARGTARGKAVRVAATGGHIQDFHDRASEGDPRFIVEGEATTGHAADELRKA